MSRFMISISIVALVLGWSMTALAISPTENDNFEDGTTMGWQEGGASPNPPINVADGGPAGAGDNFLQNVSTGTGGAGSRMVMFNQAQWTGDYNAVGPELTITADMANFGNAALSMRVAFSGGGSQFCSTVAAALPADGMWHPVSFTLSDANMTQVSGAGSLSSVLDAVGEMRILSSSAPAWIGDNIAGTLGVDNLLVFSVPVELQYFTVD